MTRRRLRRRQMGIISTNDASTAMVNLVSLGMIGFGASNLAFGDKAPIVSTHFDEEANAAFTILGGVSLLCLTLLKRPSMILKTLVAGLCISLLGTISCSANMQESVCSHLNFTVTVGTGVFLILFVATDLLRRHLLFNILIHRVNTAYRVSSTLGRSHSGIKYPLDFFLKTFFISETKLGYVGQTDDLARPHGQGTWHESTRHGEILHGVWRDGLPLGPFRSIEFSTGYTTEQIKVVYVKDRRESNSDLWFKSDRDDVAWGISFVECSTSGHFYRHLPSVTQQPGVYSSWDECVADMCEEGVFHGPCDACGSSLEKECNISVDQKGVLHVNGQESREAHVTISIEEGSIRLPDTLRPRKEAVLFIHGFNSSCDDAIKRIGQLWGLAGFPAHYYPVVFAWPACKTVCYFRAKRLCRDDQVVNDLCATLDAIFQSGCKIHVISHSMGAILLMESIQRMTPPFCLSTLSLLNPDCDIEDFVNRSYPKLRSICNVITLYADESDNALWYSQVFNRWKALGKHPYDLTMKEMDRSDQDVPVTANHLRSYRALDIDVIDVSSMDNNMHSMRHNFFNLNRLMVDDLRDILTQKRRASLRPRLTHISLNVYSFLNAPRHIKNK